MSKCPATDGTSESSESLHGQHPSPELGVYVRSVAEFVVSQTIVHIPVPPLVTVRIRFARNTAFGASKNAIVCPTTGDVGDGFDVTNLNVVAVGAGDADTVTG